MVVESRDSVELLGHDETGIIDTEINFHKSLPKS